MFVFPDVIFYVIFKSQLWRATDKFWQASVWEDIRSTGVQQRNSKTGRRKPMFKVGLHFENIKRLDNIQSQSYNFIFHLNRNDVIGIKSKIQGKCQETEIVQKKIDAKVSFSV